ncbi:hypothetical protein [Desulfobacula sp.]|uniref:hypothetical protein n=1 Tax=Desulfobacula sp. TaxID=2593537 RepID=UPI002606B82F|nr:hypothetical protein [Desulfobacula sp.]
MTLPDAVRKAAERSEAIQKQLREGKPQDQPGTPPLDGDPQPGQRDTLPEQVVQQTQKPVDTPEPEHYKDKYLTLKGKFDAEVPRLHQEIRNLQSSVSELQTKNAQLTEAGNNQNVKDPTVDEGDPLNPDDFTQYGDDFGKLINTIQTLQAQNKELTEQISQISGDVSKDRETDAKTKYENYLSQVKQAITQKGESFDALNTDQNFLNFLRQFPEHEFESRHAKLQRAEANRDLQATIEIFDEYLGSQSKEKPPDTPKPNIQPAPNNTGTDLNPPTQQSARTWTRKQIAQFYTDKAAGKFRGRDDEAKALEADIFLAPTQGRIVA